MRLAATPAPRAILDSFLDRAAALTPAGWARLDALGKRLADGTPFAFLDRARCRGVAAGRWAVPTFGADDSNADFARLAEICRTQAGASHQSGLRSNAGMALQFGFLALKNRHFLSPTAFESAFALVEPVIPLASLAPAPRD